MQRRKDRLDRTEEVIKDNACFLFLALLTTAVITIFVVCYITSLQYDALAAQIRDLERQTHNQHQTKLEWNERRSEPQSGSKFWDPKLVLEFSCRLLPSLQSLS